MSAEPLEIHDRRFLINRMIDQAPTHTLIREFFMNAQENAALAPDGQREVRIFPTEIEGVPKLTFWNTGPGMDDRELRMATNLSSSINKTMSLDGNFGIGAKVSGLTVSPAGIRYRSCKNGTVHEVTIGYDEEQGTYVRFAYQLSSGAEETVLDVTGTIETEGHDVSFDWTEVVLFGEDGIHNTVREPIGKGVVVDRSYVASQIFRRFAEFLPGVEVLVDTSMTKGGAKGESGRNRRLKTLKDILPKLPRAEEVEDPETGVKVHYIHDPKHPSYSHSLSALANPATQSTTFCALVHKGERYDIKNKKAWGSAAPNFGIPFGSRILSIEITLPATMAMPNQYRDGLTVPEDRSPLRAEHFAPMVRNLMPEWVKEEIRNQHPPSEDNLDDLQQDLQKLLDEFRVPTVAFSPNRPESDLVTDSDDGRDEAERSDLQPFDDEIQEEDEEGKELNRRLESVARRATPKKQVRKAPEGARQSKEAKALERVPVIEILTDQEEIATKGIGGRAGKYYKDGQTLFINGRYSAIDRMAAELEVQFMGQSDPEITRKLVLKAAQRFCAFRVGKATCYAISKRLAEDWSMDDLDRATSPESLSLAADDFRQSINAARKWVRAELRATPPEEPTD